MILLGTDIEGRLIRLHDAATGLRGGKPLSERVFSSFHTRMSCWPEPTVATIGFFDGVHQGHQHLIATLCRLAHERKLQSLIVTFDNHPRSILQPDRQPSLLSTLSEKFALLSRTGVDLCLSLKFTPELARLSAKEFMEIYLRQLMHVQLLLVGYNHHFGHDSEAGFSEYRQYGRTIGIDVVKDSLYEKGTACISSSEVRRALLQGDVEAAESLLGRPYSFEGEVIHGDNIGHTMGFPTVNFDIEALGKMLPADGSYAVRVHLRNKIHGGMAYIGHRPTFGDCLRRTVEVNIFDFNGDVYGCRLSVDFVKRLRGERQFDSPEALRKQLMQDREEARKILKDS